MLKGMKMSAMAAELERQLTDASYRELGFEDRLGLLVTAEWNRRQTNKVNRFIRNAHFSAPSAAVESIEYYEDRQLDKSQILRFSTCKYIEEGHHIILKGASGNGKTYIACALGNAACRRFKSVQYIRMPELLDELRFETEGIDDVRYFIQDMNNDEIPELITITGTCEADFTTTFYTVKNHKAEVIGKDLRGDHSSFKIDERTGRIIMMGAIDNLVKGAAGQAVQNMNLMFGLPEDTGLRLKASAF